MHQDEKTGLTKRIMHCAPPSTSLNVLSYDFLLVITSSASSPSPLVLCSFFKAGYLHLINTGDAEAYSM